MFQNFQAWKLHTVWDYVAFLVPLVIGGVMFWLLAQRIHKRRTDVHAQSAVKGKLKYNAQQARVFHNVTLRVAGQALHYDHLLIDAAGIVAFRSIGWGIRIYGQVDQPTWKLADNKTDTTIENPVIKLTNTFELLRRELTAQGIYGVSIDPLVVFADPFATPQLFLGRDCPCVSFPALSEWKKKRKLRAENKSQKVDFLAIAKAIESMLLPA